MPRGWWPGQASTTLSLPFRRYQGTVNTVTFSGGAGIHVTPLPWLGLYATGMGGYYLSLYNSQAGGSVFVGGEGGIEFYFTPSFGLGAGASYRHYFTGTDPFYQGLKVHLGAMVRLGMGQRKSNIEIFDIRFDPIFPIFYKHYDDHQVGTVGIRNSEKGTIENVRVSFYAPQYMDKPKQCAVIEEMKKGAEETVSLYALFTDQVLMITEGTKINAQIVVEYDYGKNELALESSDTVRMYDRNAMTWNDDRKAAAFITAKDPEVLRFSKNVAGLVREHPSKAVNLNFRIAAGLFEGLQLHGVNYVIDPQTPYTDFSSDTTAIDYLQFPVQTLEYKAGDCDDLSILYSTLLESTGIETAFITVPGHIYMAFNLGLDPEEAKKMFLNPGDLIFIDDTTWVPVEVTMVQEGFLKAWEMGAKEWRDHNPAGNASIYPIHDAWKEFEPVGLAGAPAGIAFPGQDVVMGKFTTTINRFVEREIADKVADLEGKIAASREPARLQNKLGVLYARYGIMDKAKARFETASRSQYSPAMINLGNILFLEKAYKKALAYYEQAEEMGTGSTAALVGIAKASYELENHGTVWCWGRNNYSQLGDGTDETESSTPVQVGLSNMTAIASLGSHTIALKDDSTVWCWGYNHYGQLGDGSTENSSTPVQAGLSNVTAIASGRYHTIALKNNGIVWCWGRNNIGQLGDGTDESESSTPVQVGLSDVIAIAGGGYHTIALKNNGTVWCWGKNTDGQLGDGTDETESSTPVQVGLSNVIAIAGGEDHTIALKNDGTVWCWGDNFYGQLGDGTDETESSTPVQVGLSDVIAIAGGYDHTIALKNDGTVWCWGKNNSGQLGDATDETKSSTPVQVGLSNVTAIAGGYTHTIALKDDGTVWCWGWNNYGQLGDGTEENSSTPVETRFPFYLE